MATTSLSSITPANLINMRKVRKKRTPDSVIHHLLRRAGPLSTLGTLARDMETTRQEVKEHCIRALSEIGASDEYCEFFGDVLQTEHDMNSEIYKLQQKIRRDNDTEPIDPGVLLLILQDLTRNFNQWKSNIDALAQKGSSIPPLEIDPTKLKQHSILKLLCSLETKDVNLHEGEQLTIIGAKPNRLKVQTSTGAEGFVPALCCVLPTPDKTALTATERLRIQLLCSWTECVRKTKGLLSDSLLTTCKKLAREWRPPTLNGPTIAKDRVTRRVRRILDAATRAPHCDYNKLHSCLYSLEKELISYNMNDLSRAVDKVANLDKSVLCFYNYYKQWHTYRRALASSSLRPIKVVENLADLKRVPSVPRNYKYLEYKMTVENVEIVEEILYINDREYRDEDYGCRSEKVKADQITQSEQEERKRFVIKGVVDPRDRKRVISIQDAIAEGIVDQQRGLYVNPETGDGMPIPEAMTRELIRVERATSTKTEEKTSAIGLITVKYPDEGQSYKITGAMDAVTGEKVDLIEAKRRGLIDKSESQYYLASTEESFPLHEAVMSGWITADFEGGEQRFDVKTYAVNAVVDQRMKIKVPFYEAVKRQLIDKETGNYVNNATGEKIYVVDAIKRGFLKARIVDDATGLNIDAENKMVVEKMDKIRKSVLKSVGVIKAFKEAARRTSGSGDNP